MTRHQVRSVRTLTSVAAVLALFGWAACRDAHDAAPAASADAARAPVAVEVVPVVEQPLAVTLSLPGELTAYQSVAMYPRVTGFVKSVRVDRGSVVRAGEVIATLEAPELEAQRAEAQSKLRATEAQLAGAEAKAEGDRSTYERLKAASATPGVVAGNDLVLAEKAAEASRTQVRAATGNVEAAREAARAVSDMEGYLRVTAPFAGVITERNVHPGALVGPPSGAGNAVPLVRLVENDRLRLVVAVPEAYTASIQPGAPIAFSVASFPGTSWSGTIARVAHAVDVTTRTMSVELEVANPDGRLSPGAFCQVQWPVHRASPSLFVPSSSVTSTTDRTFVVRIRNGVAEWVTVKTGLTSGTQVEVFGDLHPGDRVARRGTDEVRAGTPARAVDAKGAS